MPLLTDVISLFQPAFELRIDIRDRVQAEVVDVVSGGDRLNGPRTTDD